MSKKIQRKFTKPTQISKHLCCAICTEVFQDPTRLACGHTFCCECIVSWTGHANTCPECRTEINPELIGRDIIADKIILDLEVACIHNLCIWKGKLDSLEKHTRTCVYEKTPDWLSKLNSVMKTQPEEKQIILFEENDELHERLNEEIIGKSLSERLFIKNENSQTLLQAVFDKDPNKRRASISRLSMTIPLNEYQNLLSSGSKSTTPIKSPGQESRNDKENIFIQILSQPSTEKKDDGKRDDKENASLFPGKRKFGNSLDSQDSKKIKTN